MTLFMDVLLAVLLLVGVFVGYVQGAVRQGLWLAAVYISLLLSTISHIRVAAMLTENSKSMSPVTAQMVAFFLLFFLSALITNFMVWDIVRRRYEKGHAMNLFTHMLGAVFGAVSAFIFIALVLLALRLVTAVPWGASVEFMRQALLEMYNSRVVSVFQQVLPFVIDTTIKPFSPSLPPLFNLGS
jgi:uncharacterized membrane protein required for colicin V production